MENKIVLIAGFMLIGINLTAQPKTYDTLPNLPEHYVKRVGEFNKQPLVTGKIIMVGNSITEGGDWAKLLNDSSVINRGISGDVTFGVQHRLDDIVKRKPSKIFLLIGINDLSRNTPDEVILKNILKIVSSMRSGSPKSEIFVQSILPTNDSVKNLNHNFRGKGASIKTINAELKRNAKQLKFTFVDLYNNFLNAEGQMDVKYSTDGLHLNALGYQQWVEVLKKNGKTGIK